MGLIRPQIKPLPFLEKLSTDGQIDYGKKFKTTLVQLCYGGNQWFIHRKDITDDNTQEMLKNRLGPI